jgi:hypothetical protein
LGSRSSESTRDRLDVRLAVELALPVVRVIDIAVLDLVCARRVSKQERGTEHDDEAPTFPRLGDAVSRRYLCLHDLPKSRTQTHDSGLIDAIHAALVCPTRIRQHWLCSNKNFVL